MGSLIVDKMIVTFVGLRNLCCSAAIVGVLVGFIVESDGNRFFNGRIWILESQKWGRFELETR